MERTRYTRNLSYDLMLHRPRIILPEQPGDTLERVEFGALRADLVVQVRVPTWLAVRWVRLKLWRQRV